MKIIQNSPHFIEKSPVCLRREGRNIEKSSKKVKISGAKFGNVKYSSYVSTVRLRDMNEKMKEELIKYLKEVLRLTDKSDLDNPADWNMQEGVLLDYKEAQMVLNMMIEK